MQIVIEIPKKLTERQKLLLREFAASEDARLKQQRKGFFDKIKGLISGDETK